MRAKRYYLYQTPPPLHWYQRRIGWFGRSLVVALLLIVVSFGIVGRNITDYQIKTIAARAADEKLQKVSASPLPESSAENIVDLQSILDAWVAEHPAQKWGIVAQSLDGPSFQASINADKSFQTASLYKLFLTLPLFSQIPAEHQSGTQLNVAGTQRSVASCVDLMLRISHNECGEAIGDYVDWTKASKFLADKGYKHTAFTANSLETTAHDTADFLQNLHGEMFTRTARDTILTSLKQQRWRQGIPAGCPGCTVANKTGDLNGAVNDAAIIDYNGGTYVLVILSENGSFEQMAELTGRIQQRILDTAR